VRKPKDDRHVWKDGRCERCGRREYQVHSLYVGCLREQDRNRIAANADARSGRVIKKLSGGA